MKLLAVLSLAASAAALTVETKAGMHVIYSWSGLTPPDRKVGGIILFKANIGTNTTNIIDSLQDAYRQSPGFIPDAPLLIMTDQEGGVMGDSADPLAAATQGAKDRRSRLAPYHINTNLAPVLDVYRVEGNFIDEYGRSLGIPVSVWSGCANAFSTTQQSLGVISTAKHFPGLGDAQAGANTDLTPVNITLPLNVLRSVDMNPYIAAINGGIKMVMASWAVYPTLDTDELRTRLGFKGVTITDAIEAGSLKPFGTIAEVAVKATRAGMDILLASAQNATLSETVWGAVVAGVKDGRINSAEFEAATNGIIALRKTIRT
ncbi:glycosyl hydrolase family 3 N terminal domain-containing protein [Coprinopsis sp. MPI-PUGE-AT-0042]|nr:glycosyl hydrolase family 3 N terminal domain-containing protein [Coprinopsis sp. MPI-PUGE-AT-0042]